MIESFESDNPQSVSEDDQLLEELQAGTIEFFVRFMSLFGIPKSVGEIYGLLYISEDPLSMEQIIKRLGISLGSASQGLKMLRSLKAVRVTYKMGERKDHYVAEHEFRTLLSSFIKEEIIPQLDSSNARIEKMKEISSQLQNHDEKAFYQHRIDKINRLQKAARGLLPTLSNLLKI